MSLITGPVALMRLVTVETVTDLDRLMTRMGLPSQDASVETKFNGWLTQAAGGRLYSRRGKDLTDKFPHIAKLVAPFKKEHLIGELVYFDENGSGVSVGSGGPPTVGPAPPDRSVQFNRGGVFGGDAGFTFAVASTTAMLGPAHTAGGTANLLVGAGHTVA